MLDTDARTRRGNQMVPDLHDLLVIEKSQVRDDLWRFGRADEPHSIWGLIERSDVGGVAIAKPQGEATLWRDDGVTALCLVATRPNERTIEYDLSWRSLEGPLYRRAPAVATTAPHQRETLGERAKRLRRQRTEVDSESRAR